MKKVFLALAAIAMMASFSSCKKTCECTYTVLGVSTTVEVNLDELNDENVKNCKDLSNKGLSFNGVNLANADCK